MAGVESLIPARMFHFTQSLPDKVPGLVLYTITWMTWATASTFMKVVHHTKKTKALLWVETADRHCNAPFPETSESKINARPARTTHGALGHTGLKIQNLLHCHS